VEQTESTGPHTGLCEAYLFFSYRIERDTDQPGFQAAHTSTTHTWPSFPVPRRTAGSLLFTGIIDQ